MFKLDRTLGNSHRYDISNFIRRVQNGYYDITDSRLIEELRKTDVMPKYTVTTEINRPDLLSESIYGEGVTQLWWIIMLVNNLRSPYDIKIGMTIRHPSIQLLENIYFKLNSQSTSSNIKRTSTTEVL